MLRKFLWCDIIISIRENSETTVRDERCFDIIKVIDILRKYYPSEGSKVAKRLNNRSKGSILVTAQYYGIKFDKVCKEWTIEEDEVIYEFYLKHKESSFNRISELLQELSNNGFTEHGAKSVYMKLHNFSYLETGYGFSHASKQSKSVHMNNKKVTIWFYILKGRLNSIFFLFQAVFVKKVQIGIVKLQLYKGL